MELKYVPLHLYRSKIEYDAMKQIHAFHKTWINPQNVPNDEFAWVKMRLYALISQLTGYASPLQEFELKCSEKWWGVQGCTRPYSMVEPNVVEYYERAGKYTDLPPIPRRVAKFYAANTHHVTWEEVWRTAAIKDTNSGVDGWQSRKTPGLARECFENAIYSPDDLDPVVLGQKFERNKVRNIHMDSFSNYFRAAKVWRPLKLANDKLPEMKRRSDLSYDAYVRAWFKAHPEYAVIEGDAEGMDTWVDKIKVESVERVFMRYARDLTFASDFERAHLFWDMPLITPKGVIEGPHSLFSGLYPTHDVECMWMKACMEDLIDNLHWKTFPKPDDYLLMICGDDVALLVDLHKLIDLPSQSDVANHWMKWGMLARPDKQRIAVNEGVFFCKRYYHPRLPRSVYPVTLATNSFVHPRHSDKLVPNGYNVVRFCALFDNVGIHHPKYLDAIQLMLTLFPWLTKIVPDAEDLARYNKNLDNYRSKVLGESFSLKESPTAAILATIRNS